MQPEGGFAVEGAGLPGVAGAGTMEPVVAAESSHCVKLPNKGVGWAPVVAASVASAEPEPPSAGTSKPKAILAPVAGKIGLLPGRRPTVATGQNHERRMSPTE